MQDNEPSPAESPRSHRRPTIYDIAERLDLSPSTVSRALSKPGRINATTVARIRAVAAELGYRVNPMARALPTGMSGTFAIVLPDITNPVHFGLIRGAEQVARENGYTLVVSESQGSPALERETIEALQQSVDGLLVVASRLGEEQLRDLATVKPIVGANHSSPDLPTVIPNLQAGLTAVVDHLQQLGHRSVAYLGIPGLEINRARWNILMELTRDRSMSVVEIAIDSSGVDAGAGSLQRIRASGVTAVLAYNDLVAHGVLHAARAAKLEIPQSFSVVGFDDIFSAELAVPSLTTLRSPLHEIGATAMTVLVDRDVNRTPSQIILPIELVVRESTGVAPEESHRARRTVSRG